MKAIKTIYLGPTNTKGARIKATDGDTNSFIMNYTYELCVDQNHQIAARALCRKMKWTGKLIMGSFPNFNVHVFTEKKGK